MRRFFITATLAGALFAMSDLAAADGPEPDASSCLSDPCLPAAAQVIPDGWSNVDIREIAFNAPFDASGFNEGGAFIELDGIARFIPFSEWRVDCPGGRDYCFTVATGGATRLRFYLKDSAGNTQPGVGLEFFVALDKAVPTGPFPRNAENPSANRRPLIQWDAGADYGSGVRQYIVCLIETSYFNEPTDGECPMGSWSATLEHIDGQAGYSWRPDKDLNYGEYSAGIFIRDRAGNFSPYLPAPDLKLTNGLPFLSFPERRYLAGDYAVAGVSRRGGGPGKYRFAVLYHDLENLPPTRARVLLDASAAQSAVLEMRGGLEAAGPPAWHDGDFRNGELYFAEKRLDYTPKTRGKIGYRFDFASRLGAAVSAGADGARDPTEKRTLKLDPYADARDDLIAIYGNVLRAGRGSFTVSLSGAMLRGKTINMRLFNAEGRMLRAIIANRPYRESDRAIQLTPGENLPRLTPGLYYLVLSVDGKNRRKPLLVRP